MLDANGRGKDIVRCEAWSAGTGAEPESLPPQVLLSAKKAAAPLRVPNPLVPQMPMRFAPFVVLETNTTL